MNDMNLFRKILISSIPYNHNWSPKQPFCWHPINKDADYTKSGQPRIVDTVSLAALVAGNSASTLAKPTW
jgi:hypothetical protein